MGRNREGCGKEWRRLWGGMEKDEGRNGRGSGILLCVLGMDDPYRYIRL